MSAQLNPTANSFLSDGFSKYSSIGERLKKCMKSWIKSIRKRSKKLVSLSFFALSKFISLSLSLRRGTRVAMTKGTH